MLLLPTLLLLKRPCPPPKETLEWIEKNKKTKLCPNCGTAIEKNHGVCLFKIAHYFPNEKEISIH